MRGAAFGLAYQLIYFTKGFNPEFMSKFEADFQDSHNKY
jgi:hypothetical protein